MVSLEGFNASSADPSTNIEPIPEGRYLAIITDSVLKPTGRGDGHYLEFTFQVIEYPYKGHLLRSRLNLDSPNGKVVEIACGELSAICRAVGHMHPRNSVELHGVPLVIIVGIRRSKETGEALNEVRGYAKAEAAHDGTREQSTIETPP